MSSKGWPRVIASTFWVLAGAQNQPLLSTIATIPALSTFSSVLNVTGGNKLNPAFEERFNSALDGRNYTAFVPTNDAFAKVSSSLVGALSSAPAYPILESILRTHIAEGLVTSTDIISASPVMAIEGFPLAAQSTGAGFIFVNGQAKIVAVDSFSSNGVVHQIDQILNPFTSYFGVSNATIAPQTFDTEGTTADILLNDERLTHTRDILLALQPDFIHGRLKLSKPGGALQIFAAPSNGAFAAAPPGTVESSIAPSNQPLSLQLFTFGLLDTDTKYEDLEFSAGPIQVASAFTGINVTARQTPGAATFLNNAAVQAQVCGQEGGCVWILDRILDPLYLAFGPLNRAGS
ncbi:hypothetical protein N0V93_004285 [Gnomoniopsis smithogilvyi]|uniref:FAS1 domain-containing protein n=1 Tax=Gnomoniopsis smithogilvyi TaxID=1191159 RepID=A0A9W8YUF1_9PEZI|nr:hypothetical protein N0V93_004285 [Gnomoniopsis smithogilvyi]